MFHGTPQGWVPASCDGYSQTAVLKPEEGSPGFLSTPPRSHARLVSAELPLREECHVSRLHLGHVSEAPDVGVPLGQHELLVDVVALRGG